MVHCYNFIVIIILLFTTKTTAQVGVTPSCTLSSQCSSSSSNCICVNAKQIPLPLTASGAIELVKNKCIEDDAYFSGTACPAGSTTFNEQRASNFQYCSGSTTTEATTNCQAGSLQNAKAVRSSFTTTSSSCKTNPTWRGNDPSYGTNADGTHYVIYENDPTLNFQISVPGIGATTFANPMTSMIPLLDITLNYNSNGELVKKIVVTGRSSSAARMVVAAFRSFKNTWGWVDDAN
eukprot:851117_1